MTRGERQTVLFDSPTPRVVLLVCDPRALYAYWMVDGQAAAACPPGGEVVLRLYDLSAEQQLGEGDKIFIDYSCLEGRDGGVLSGVEPERCYQAALGVRSPDGAWRQIALSNPAQTPPEGPSRWADAHFATLPWESDLRAFAPPEPLMAPRLDAFDVPSGWRRAPAVEATAPLAAPADAGPDVVPPNSSEALALTTAHGPDGQAVTDDAAVLEPVWRGNQRVRRAALPFAGTWPVEPAPGEREVETPTEEPAPACSERSAVAPAASASGAAPRHVRRANGTSSGRSVEPLPRYGVPTVAGQRIVSANPHGAASADLAIGSVRRGSD